MLQERRTPAGMTQGPGASAGASRAGQAVTLRGTSAGRRRHSGPRPDKKSMNPYLTKWHDTCIWYMA